ncbi:hypothetical protein EGW08_000956 [Elysia chlorotica]|uniref:LolA-like domain-containing protein n=1 Tax=Elysia chlorotica TaxID=188477 RepID=A0A433UBV5_ELYCH|nr:hypothetical protein EGW08_000956 [Elysia chlorotica]
MRVIRMGVVVPMAATCLIMWLESFALGDYDETFCDRRTKRAKLIDPGPEPFFFDDYSVLSEAAFLKVENQSDAMVTHQELFYSKSKKQVVLNQETPRDNFWVFVDQQSEDCIYKKGSQQCMAEEGDCTETEKAVGFGNRENGKIVIGSPSERLDYPTNITKRYGLSPLRVRGIKTNRIGFCSYDEDTDETILSVHYILDPTAFKNMDQTQNILLGSIRLSKTPNGPVSKRRLDFTGYTNLSPSQLVNGFGLGESKCGTIQSAFTSRQPPQPTVRFSFINQAFVTGPDLIKAYFIYSTKDEYNLNSQLAVEVRDEPVDNQLEKNTVMEVEDYAGKVYYKYSVTYANCTVTSLLDQEHSAQQASTRSFWQLDLPEPTYLGVYNVRDIPCDAWAFKPIKNDETSIRLYTATSDWLVDHNYKKDFFYPVLRVDSGIGMAIFSEIYAFKDNPGYHIPFLNTCFQQDDVVTGEVTLMMNIYSDIGADFTRFEYKFRSLIMRITGIKSAMRIASITPRASSSNPHSESVVSFKILGKLTGFDNRDDGVYRYDPVTPQQAIELIRKQVDVGNMKFTLDSQALTFEFKKGSLAISQSGENLNYVDPAAPGYSKGVMAGVSIVVLVVSLVLGVAAVFAYKRWTEGAGGGPSISMKALEEEI